MIIDVGIDVSKGYADIAAFPEGKSIAALQRYDDTPSGHVLLRKYFDNLCTHSVTSMRVGAESTAGYERSWIRCTQQWRDAHGGEALSVSAIIVDPRAVKYLAASLPIRCKTDQSSAMAIAEYLRQRGSHLEDAHESEGARGFFRVTMSQVTTGAKILNQIKALMALVHPALVPKCANANGLSGWICQLLLRYPTNARLQKAQLRTLVKIPYLTEECAKDLRSTALAIQTAGGGYFEEEEMKSLVQDYLDNTASLKKKWNILQGHFEDQSDYHRMLSIRGLGQKSAAGILAEIPSFAHFHSAKSLIAFLGLDPTFEQSGDEVINKGISHRGPARLRGLLCQTAFAACNCNPAIRRLYLRLTAKGKPHTLALVACAAKLVRIAYGCVLSKTNWEEDYEENNRCPIGSDGRTSSEPLGRKQVDNTLDSKAPVSAKESRSRKKLLMGTKTEAREKTAGPSRDQSPKKERSPAAQKIINTKKIKQPKRDQT